MKKGFAAALVLWVDRGDGARVANTFGAPAASLLAMFWPHVFVSVAGSSPRDSRSPWRIGQLPASSSGAEWFPRRERALATGIFTPERTSVRSSRRSSCRYHHSLRVGGRVPRAGAIDSCAAAWWFMYDHHRSSSARTKAELAHIRSDPPRNRQGSVVYDPAASADLGVASRVHDRPDLGLPVWMPDFFSRMYGLSLLQSVAARGSTLSPTSAAWWRLAVLVADPARGTVMRSRKTAMLVCAVAVIPIIAASRVNSIWGAVALVSLAAAALRVVGHVYMLVSDMFPRQAVGSVVGFGGMTARSAHADRQVTGTFCRRRAAISRCYHRGHDV